MVDITDNLCSKQVNFSLKSAVYNQERVLMERVQKLKIDVKGNLVQLSNVIPIRQITAIFACTRMSMEQYIQ